MKVLIVENEFYLAQSVSQKLSDFDFVCDIATKISEINKENHYDIVLLSTSIDGFMNVVECFCKNTIVLLLVSYVSQDTVSTPIKMGAKDYIQKPFMIEELVRKMSFLLEHSKLHLQNQIYENFILSHFTNCNIEKEIIKNTKLPIAIRTNREKYADCFVYHYILSKNKALEIVDFEYQNIEKLKLDDKNIYYFKNYHFLSSENKIKLESFIKNMQYIIHCGDNNEELSIKTLDLNDPNTQNLENNILTIDEYIKYIITKYQEIYPDTELSKKLGISRKSLWERRKKYEISRKK